ncbi:MAG: RNA polymerase sigma factor [Gammaproteobacteria bacterium]|nr:RNA polymerase sigma factor [Gammaproteobacteria bacterium]
MAAVPQDFLIRSSEEKSAKSGSCFVQYLHQNFDSALRSFLMRKLGNIADVEDFSQEVYLRLVRVSSVERILCDKAFIFTIARNLLCDRSRRLSTRLAQASSGEDWEIPPDHSLDPATRAEDQERLDTMLAALDGLNDKSRQAFWMSRLDGLSYSEIACRIDVSISMVEKLISAALRAIRSAANAEGK